MFSDGIVVVHVVEGFREHLLPVGNFKDPWNVKLIVISSMRAFKMSIFFRMFEVVLDKFATETGK